ncbi:MAG: hypothetical protein WKG07_39330 [Hymenobacter sp.]
MPDHIREFLALMRQRVHRMESLITGILALARVGRVAEANEAVFVRQLLREITGYLDLPQGIQLELPFFLPTLTTNRGAASAGVHQPDQQRHKVPRPPRQGHHHASAATMRTTTSTSSRCTTTGRASRPNTTSASSSSSKPWWSATRWKAPG